MTVTRLRHEFVEEAPAELETGVLYVSMTFRTTLHLCCCGCENVVVLPLRPAAWRITFDGETISMAPSVGNWSFPCRSHYWIRSSWITWAGDWSDEEVAAGRRRALLERGADVIEPDQARPAETTGGWIRRLLYRIVGAGRE